MFALTRSLITVDSPQWYCSIGYLKFLRRSSFDSTRCRNDVSSVIPPRKRSSSNITFYVSQEIIVVSKAFALKASSVPSVHSEAPFTMNCVRRRLLFGGQPRHGRGNMIASSRNRSKITVPSRRNLPSTSIDANWVRESTEPAFRSLCTSTTAWRKALFAVVVATLFASSRAQVGPELRPHQANPQASPECGRGDVCTPPDNRIGGSRVHEQADDWSSLA